MEMNITALYFSPTKGTKKAVECLLTCFDNVEKKTLVDNTLPKQREIIHEFKNEDLVVVANPVYAGQLPPAMGLWKNLRGNVLHVLLWPAMVTVITMILWRKCSRCWRSVVFR